MNNPSPFAPPNSNPEQKNSSRGRVRLAVFCILSVHIVALMALLMIGCRKPQEADIPAPETNQIADVPPMDLPSNVDNTMPTNGALTAATPPDTNPPVPPPIFNTAPPAPAAGQEYTIVKGDNFSTIAKKYPGVTAKGIQDANPSVQPTKLKIGQKIQIPAPSVGSSVNTMAPVPDSSASRGDYTVKSGDTLTTIAGRHGVSVKALRSANSLTTDKIRVGQKLKLPAKATTPVAPVDTAPVPMPQANPSTSPQQP